MKWTDSQDIAIALADAHPDVDPRRINFVDLRNLIVALPEAIQAAWIEEA
jgi:FeS assembly protein IscX